MADIPHDGNAPRTVQTVDTNFDIIDCLEKRDKAGVTELATTLDISKSAVHLHLTTLVNHGRVENVDGQEERIPMGDAILVRIQESDRVLREFEGVLRVY